VGWKQRKEVARDLKTIYTAATEAEAEVRLDEFAAKWDAKSRTHTTTVKGF
jgi:putative transposase